MFYSVLIVPGVHEDVKQALRRVHRKSVEGRHRFVTTLTSELSELAFVARNEARVVDLACNQAANAGCP